MKNINLKKDIGLARLLMLLGLVVCLVVGTYAAYNNQVFQRGVVRNRDSEEIRFTSNLLKPYALSGENDEKKYETVLYPFSEDTKEEDTLKIPLKIANYLLGNDNLISEKDITFDLYIQLKDLSEGSKYTINNEVISGDSFEIAGLTLKGRKPNQVDYIIGITGKDLNRLTIVIEAKPRDMGRRILAAYICPCTNSQVNPFSYSGTFLDSKSDNLPDAYYGYNYEVSISSGRAKVTLSWDPIYVKLDPYFLKKLESRQDLNVEETKAYLYNESQGSIQFLMDQTLGEDDYVILFYPLQEKKGELIQKIGNTWDGMKQMVSVKAAEVNISQ